MTFWGDFQGVRFSKKCLHGIMQAHYDLKGRQTGVFQTGGFPDLDVSFLFCPFLSFSGLSRFFRDFPDLLGDSPDFPDSSLFSFSAY